MKPPTPRLRVGDVIPIGPADEINRSALGYIKARKTRAATMAAKATAGRAAKNAHEAGARKAAQEDQDRSQRLADPYEQAKAFLQRKGYAVYSGKLCEPKRKGVVVGRRTLADERAVMAYAASLGWQRAVTAK